MISPAILFISSSVALSHRAFWAGEIKSGWRVAECAHTNSLSSSLSAVVLLTKEERGEGQGEEAFFSEHPFLITPVLARIEVWSLMFEVFPVSSSP